jgi:hypothetical protein
VWECLQWRVRKPSWQGHRAFVEDVFVVGDFQQGGLEFPFRSSREVSIGHPEVSTGKAEHS